MSSIKTLYIVGSSFLFFMVSLFLFVEMPEGDDPFMVQALVASAAFMILHQGVINYKVREITNWIQIDIMFLLMFFFVHFWLWIAIRYGSIGVSWGISAQLGRVNYAVALSLLGMSAFVFGYNVRANIGQYQMKEVISHPRWEKAGLILLYAGAALTVSYALYFGASAFEGSYTGSEVGGLGTRSIYVLLGILLKLGILIVLISNADEQSFIPKCKLPLVVMTCASSMFLVLGDRSEFLNMLAVMAFAYTRYFRKITLPVLAIGVVVVAFMMSAVEMARIEKHRSLTAIYEAATSNSDRVSSMQGLNGISASGGVMLGAVYAVPKHHAYFNGELKIIELLGIIPYGRALLFDPAWIGRFGTSSDFLTWFLLGPNSKSGTGTTVVADLYLDFGPVGVVIGLLLLGNIAGYLHKKVNESNSLERAVVFCYFAGLLVLLPRYSLLMTIRGLIWPVVFLWLMGALLGLSRQPLRETSGESP